jgi:uncharacterized protein YjbI with pentapeptide repeats
MDAYNMTAKNYSGKFISSKEFIGRDLQGCKFEITTKLNNVLFFQNLFSSFLLSFLSSFATAYAALFTANFISIGGYWTFASTIVITIAGLLFLHILGFGFGKDSIDIVAIAGAYSILLTFITTKIKWLYVVAIFAVFSGSLILTNYSIFFNALSIDRKLYTCISIALLYASWSIYISYEVSKKKNPKYQIIWDRVIAYAALGGTSFKGTDLTRANFTNSDLRTANFYQVKSIDLVRWEGVKNIHFANFSNTIMKDPKVRDLLVNLSYIYHNTKTGLEMRVSYQGADLRGANLIGANLKGINLEDADLSGADLTNTNLGGANLKNVKLLGATLGGSNLQDASLMLALFDGASLRDANLTGACLDITRLRESKDIEGIKCDFFFCKDKNDKNFVESSDRRPSVGIYTNGLFSRLVIESANMTNLIFLSEPSRLSEPAKEIENILRKLSLIHPVNTISDKVKIAKMAISEIDKNNPPLIKKIGRASTAGALGALEELIKHPVSKFFIEFYKEFRSENNP